MRRCPLIGGALGFDWLRSTWTSFEDHAHTHSKYGDPDWSESGHQSGDAPFFFWPLYFWFSSTAVPLNKRDGPIRLRNRENECRSFDWSPVMDVVSSSGRRGFRLLLHLSSFSDAIIKKSNVRNRRKKNGFES